VTTPEYFYVSQYPQVQEHEPNDSIGQANPVTLPATIAGTIDHGNDQDTYSFDVKSGDRLIFDVEGFKRFAPPQNNMEGIVYLDSYIVLRDASGRELAYNDDFNKVDPFLAFEFPTAGKYFITIRDSTYRGQGNFHYRLTIGNRPTITAVFPPGGTRGSRVNATVFGYNLDSSGANTVRRFIPIESSGGAQEYRVTTSGGISNALPIIASDYPEISEVEPNDRIQDATPIVVPAVCNGKFDTLTDVDAYRFQAQGGVRLLVETQAARLGSPVDTFVSFMDRAGHILKEDDDSGGSGDSRMEVDIPRTDEYVVFVRNQVRSGVGPQQFYRLSVRPLQPSFSVVFRQEGVNRQGGQTMVPVDSIAVPQGGDTEFEVQINRQEGQSGDVQLGLNMPPTVKGFVLEQLIKTMKADEPGGTPKVVKVQVVKAPVVKNGQGTATMRISAPADMAPGAYLGIYMKASGVAGAQPFTVNKRLWITVSPKQ
jgi:hypothetical protein